MTSDWGYCEPLDQKLPLGIKLMESHLWHTYIFITNKGIVKILTHYLCRTVSGIDVNRADGGVINKVKRSHIIQTSRMILMFVGE